MKVWFDVDCERILSTIRDMCPDCEEMYCTENENYINEVTQHKRDGCFVTYIEEAKIKTINMQIKIPGGSRLATVDDLEQAFLVQQIPPNFAYGLARIIPLSHKIIVE